jgi:hypothetical protein
MPAQVMPAVCIVTGWLAPAGLDILSNAVVLPGRSDLGYNTRLPWMRPKIHIGARRLDRNESSIDIGA